MISFRQQLWRWLLALLTAVGLLAGASAFWTTLHESEEFLDRQLFEIALNIAATTGTTTALPEPGPISPRPANGEHSDGHDDQSDTEVSEDPEDAIAVQVWASTETPLYAAPVGIDISLQARQGFADTEGAGTAWRTYTLITPGRIVQISQQTVARRIFAESAALNSLIPIAALIPLSWLLLWLVLRRVTRRLESLVTAIAHRHINSDTPISDSDMPAELVPLVGAVNDLVDRLQRALAAQKRFVSDAAHQLRTPLAAVKLQLGNLHHAAPGETDTKRLDDLARGVDRAASLTDQLLKLARYDAGDARPEFGRIDATALLRDCIADVLPLADHRHLDIGLDADSPEGPILIEGNETDLRILIGNLLDNAVRYTPQGGVIDVGLTVAGSGEHRKATVEIRDSGPGIADGAISQVFDRFYRASDPNSEGSGLGLSIAGRIATLHNTHIDLENRHGKNGDIAGLNARIAFVAG
ncbi:MAG: HAMP domain-containing protein [Alphaproteobacteria bacterium]|nr:HAMP domain-containing protein [Alphaproteobacteria bacterium]